MHFHSITKQIKLIRQQYIVHIPQIDIFRLQKNIRWTYQNGHNNMMTYVMDYECVYRAIIIQLNDN